MNTERLELMYTMLKEVDAGTWKPTVFPPGDEAPIAQGVELNMGLWCAARWCAARWCGYSACAVGHAMLDKRFEEQGLLTMERGDYLPMLVTDGFRDATSWGAVVMFFDIDWCEAEHLFSESAYVARGVTAAHVADRVRRFIDRGGV